MISSIEWFRDLGFFLPYGLRCLGALVLKRKGEHGTWYAYPLLKSDWHHHLSHSMGDNYFHSQSRRLTGKYSVQYQTSTSKEKLLCLKGRAKNTVYRGTRVAQSVECLALDLGLTWVLCWQQGNCLGFSLFLSLPLPWSLSLKKEINLKKKENIVYN